MAKKLQTLLGNDHPLFIANIADLERASGNSGIDVKLIADVTEKAHAVMRRRWNYIKLSMPQSGPGGRKNC